MDWSVPWWPHRDPGQLRQALIFPLPPSLCKKHSWGFSSVVQAPLTAPGPTLDLRYQKENRQIRVVFAAHSVWLQRLEGWTSRWLVNCHPSQCPACQRSTPHLLLPVCCPCLPCVYTGEEPAWGSACLTVSLNAVVPRRIHCLHRPSFIPRQSSAPVWKCHTPTVH